MKLLIVLITYNRLNYTKKTLKYLHDTIDINTDYHLVVVDNDSTDGTKEYLKNLLKRNRIDQLILNPENYYPGKACNIGWFEGLKRYPHATHLMRLDNDMCLLKGWDLKAAEYFEKIPELGQLGLDYSAVAGPEAQGKRLTLNGMTINHWPGNVGGPNIISRAVWEKGIIYDETRWQSAGKGTHTIQEDVKFSQEIMVRGFIMGHWTDKLGYTFADESNWKDYPEYYTKTFTERGYDDLLEKLK
jgi:glycosyltransferase involved in cell wall biosynthesis